jgi:hypothetical protein
MGIMGKTQGASTLRIPAKNDVRMIIMRSLLL